MTEVKPEFSPDDALKELERTVRRLRKRAEIKLYATRRRVADVALVLESGKFGELNDRGELGTAGSELDAAVAALYTAWEARELLRQVNHADSLECSRNVAAQAAGTAQVSP